MSITRAVTPEDLSNLQDFFYTEGGKLFARRAYCNRVKADQEVGCDNGKGYLIVMCKGRLYLVHRVIYFLYYKVWPEGVVDHINGDRKDNRPENLRDITQSKNTKSYGTAHKDSTSLYRGVHWFKRYSKWQAQIMCDGRRKHLGYFSCEQEAALAWNFAALQLGFNKEALNNVT